MANSLMAVRDFPVIPDDPFEKPCSVVRSWVSKLSFKQQTVLLTAFAWIWQGKAGCFQKLLQGHADDNLAQCLPRPRYFYGVQVDWGGCIEIQ